MQLGRVSSLERKHKDLHMRIEALEAENAPDKYIKPLKVEKLKLKDEITRLNADIYSHGMHTPGNVVHET